MTVGDSVIEWSIPFGRQYRKLTPSSRKQVDRTLRALAGEPSRPGLNAERVQGARPGIFSCRVNHGVRLIYERLDSGKRLLLWAVAHREDAYRAAVSRLFSPVGQPTKDPYGGSSLSSRRVGGPIRLYSVDDISADIMSVLGQGYDEAGEIADMIGRIADLGTAGMAQPFAGYTSPELVNILPGDDPGSCAPVVLGICFDDDSFGDRVRELVYHAEFHCPDTRLVILLTSQWDAAEWRNGHQRAIAAMHADVMVILVGPRQELHRIF